MRIVIAMTRHETGASSPMVADRTRFEARSAHVGEAARSAHVGEAAWGAHVGEAARSAHVGTHVPSRVRASRRWTGSAPAVHSAEGGTTGAVVFTSAFWPRWRR